MTQGSSWRTVGLLIVFLPHLLLVASLSSIEEGILLNVINSPGFDAPPSWRADNVSTACTTFVGIGCADGGLGAIDQIRLNSALDSIAQRISGVFPCDFFDLPELRTLALYDQRDLAGEPVRCQERICANSSLHLLELSYNGLTGPLPMLSQCVNLTFIGFRQNKMNGSIPVDDWVTLADLEYVSVGLNPQIRTAFPEALLRRPKITHLDIADLHYSGTFPSDINKTNMELLDIRRSNLNGTIPDWILSNPWTVGLHISYTDMDCPNATFLAQLYSVIDLDIAGLRNCRPQNLPSTSKSIMFPTHMTDKRPDFPTANFTFGNTKLQISIFGRRVFVYPKEQATGTVFTAEYILLDLQAVTVAENFAGYPYPRNQSEILPYHSAVFSNNNTTVQMNANLRGGGRCALIFDLDQPDSGVKFSIEVEDLPGSNVTNANILLGYQLTLRQPISRNGLDLELTDLGGFTLVDTDLQHLSSNFAGGSVQLKAASERLEMEITFDPYFVIDGVQAQESINTWITLHSLTPFGLMQYIEETLPPGGLPALEADQDFTVVSSLIFPKGFQKKLRYDPSINFNLLFSTSTPTAPTAPGVAPPEGLGSGAIAGIVVGVVVVAAIATTAAILVLFKKQALPFQTRGTDKLKLGHKPNQEPMTKTSTSESKNWKNSVSPTSSV